MDVIADLHIHGRYAQACSKITTLKHLADSARIKGLSLLGTGDMLHPQWFEEITSTLTEDEHGILWDKSRFPFVWQTEISLIYTHYGKGRRVHHVVLAPNREVVEQIRDTLLKRGRLDYDGRPIFGMSSVEFVDMMRSISPDIEIIPAHVWTSWFAIFGSKSGYDSVEECFEDRAKYVHALETGMSSDPAMNWRLSKLDKYNLVSFSDPHSSHPWRLGREATVFDLPKLTYKNLIHAIRTGEGLKRTIETFPEYGKYHEDGHRACNVHLTPKESKKINGLCPACRRPLTLGVAYRVEELADREPGFVRKNAVPFDRLIPLSELIAAVYSTKLLTSRTVSEVYSLLIRHFGNEYTVLREASFDQLNAVIPAKLSSLVLKNREGSLSLDPGYDGVYGTIRLASDDLVKQPRLQKSLAEF